VDTFQFQRAQPKDETLPYQMDVAGSAHHTQITTQPPEDWVIATTVRHHFDMVVSWLFANRIGNKLQKEWKLEQAIEKHVNPEYLDELHKLPYYKDHPNSLLPHLRYANCVMKHERLEEDLAVFLRRIGKTTPVQLRTIGEKPRLGMPCDTLLTDEMKAAIIERYGEEMERFGYLKDGVAVGYT
jgi:hypothetical protein